MLDPSNEYLDGKRLQHLTDLLQHNQVVSLLLLIYILPSIHYYTQTPTTLDLSNNRIGSFGI